ncbi:MAG: single-stranded-DNA-specific exonuclease RecJ [Cyanobacteria bacterium SZAS-4]|nr:single-stranded-DNA-specific exonuclease RecJ [Cyanobacteria bacterium SZAS-4]
MTTSLAGTAGFAGGDEQARLSALGKFWQIYPTSQFTPDFIDAADGSTLLAQILHARGVLQAEEAKTFLNTDLYTATGPMELPDVDKAVVRISEAIGKGQHITVYGDYDVDGVTGTSVLVTVLRKLGADVDFYIPNRATEGYGLNIKAVSILASKHRTKLIISCDCGVSNFAEIKLAKSLGVDTLVLDHHTMPEMLPPAVGIVHPKRLHEEHPLFHLPGVGVAYKVCEALLIDKNMPEEVPSLLDYVTLGMIADLVPLIRENRYLVKIGLPILINSARPGIQALLAQVKKSDDTDLVGFGLAPRINAVGRLADAKIAVDLLTTEDEDYADKLARQLQTDNLRRQELCEEIYSKAESMISRKLDLDQDKCIAIYDEGWHHGVVGIVASRLVEKYNRPVFIGELDPVEGIVKGSARSIDAIDLYEVLKHNDHLLAKYGGHKMAAGFAVEADKAEALCRGLTDTCNRMLIDKPLKATVKIDIEVEPATVNEQMAKLLTKLAPFGMWNKKPTLCMKSVTCVATRILGKDGKHHRVTLEDTQTNKTFECVMWNTRGNVPNDRQVIDAVFTPEINVFNNRERLQLVLSDWRDSNTMVYAPPPQIKAIPNAIPTRKTTGISDYTPSKVNVVAEAPAGETASEESSIQGTSSATTSAPTKTPEDFTPNRDFTSQSSKLVWKDLRNHVKAVEILSKAVEKLGTNVSIFAENSPKQLAFEFVDRMTVGRKQHLIVWQTPPSNIVFQELLVTSGAQTIYLVSVPESEDAYDSNVFLKKLFGLVKFAVNKKDGQVEGEKLASVLGVTKMSVALGLTILKKVNLIDWFSEAGFINLDLLGPATGNAEELPEFKQLVLSLKAAKEFKDWCSSASLKEIQLAVMPNHIGLGSQADALESFQSDDEEEMEQTNEYPSGQEQVGEVKPSA